MKQVKKFLEGEPIPEGAKYLKSERQNYGASYEKIVDSGFLFDTVGVYQPTKMYHFYEIEVSDEHK